MTEPKEFSCFDSSPTNTGNVGQDRDWEEIRSPYIFEGDEIYEVSEDDFFPDQNI